MVHYVGFFQELKHGEPDGGSLIAVTGGGDEAIRETMAKYLDDGYIIATTGESTEDILDTQRTNSGALDVRTDGEWVWPGDLAYYVRRYNVALPEKFIERARAHNWATPTPSEEELIIVRNEMIPPAY